MFAPFSEVSKAIFCRYCHFLSHQASAHDNTGRQGEEEESPRYHRSIFSIRRAA